MDYLYASFLRGQMIAMGVVKHAARVYFWEVRAKVQDEYNLCLNKNNTNIDLEEGNISYPHLAILAARLK